MTIPTFRYGDTGPNVLQLQEKILEARYEITRYDGDVLGDETWSVLALVAEDCGLELPWSEVDGKPSVVPEEVVRALWDPDPELAPAKSDCTSAPCRVEPLFKLYDLREERVVVRPKVRIANGKAVHTKPKTGLMLHQTAVEFGVTKNQIRAANGDTDLALARRALNISTPVTIFTTPDMRVLLVLSAPFTWHMNHGNGANGETLGVEIAGRFEGLLGDRSTLWCPDGRGTCVPTRVTDEVVQGWRAAIVHVVELARTEGHPLVDLFAHRQSSETRRSDPGEFLWEQVAIPVADEVGLKIHPNRVWGSGRRLPEQWDPLGEARY